MNVAQEFDSLYRAAKALTLDRGRGEAALVTITRTRGSTFRRAGASMLVHRDGSMVCELSGGCPQRDIVLRAQHAMECAEGALVAYGRDSNYDVMIETGCGGELEVLIEPWHEAEDLQFLDAIAALHARRTPGVMASLFAVDGGAIGRRPMRLVQGSGSLWTNIGQAALKQQVLANLPMQAIPTGGAITQQMDNQGQRYDALLETLRPPHALLIVGDSAGANLLAQLGHQLGWRTTVVSTRESAERATDGVQRVYKTPVALLSDVLLDSQTSVVVMTHRLELDLAYVAPLLATPVRYIGVIGSRQRADQVRAAFPHADDRLHVPAGLDIGSETPQEIALAIAAEILALRHGRSGDSLVHTQTSIHP
ncbi:XdhC family protein [Dyella japonica]|uniref:Xanthine dehydrogenase n=1 Tax=Dyella japonica DSM 16301 TaxID=1440762 RepID=A0A0G9H4A1_9GAMM|nr:XdhC/CoxI family protein [Dyella japonica]KLD64064.1 hypothetical protein Y882_09275 [Dyella japonica DSM 16301]